MFFIYQNINHQLSYAIKNKDIRRLAPGAKVYLYALYGMINVGIIILGCYQISYIILN